MMWKGVPLLVSICLLCCQAALGHDKYAYIAFVNDVHNRIEEEDPTTSTPCSAKARAAGTCVGGWPRISSAVKSLRLQAQKEGAAFFFLDAGDEFTGTMWDAVYQGQTVAPLLLNKVKPDVMVSGLALVQLLGTQCFSHKVPSFSTVQRLDDCCAVQIDTAVARSDWPSFEQLLCWCDCTTVNATAYPTAGTAPNSSLWHTIHHPCFNTHTAHV
jgi:hypothetical protein